MASPVGGDFRSTYFGPVLSRASAQLVLLLAAVESHETSFTSPHFATITSSLGDAISSLSDAAYASEHDSTDPS